MLRINSDLSVLQLGDMVNLSIATTSWCVLCILHTVPSNSFAMGICNTKTSAATSSTVAAAKMLSWPCPIDGCQGWGFFSTVSGMKKKKNLSIRYCAQLNIKALLCLNAHLHQCTPLRIQKLQGWKKLWKTLRSPLWFIMSALDLASQGGTCCGWCLPFLLQNGNIVPWKSATSPLKCLVGVLH